MTPDIVLRFFNYYQLPDNGAWGSLHIILDDGNFKDDHVDYCIHAADIKGDIEGLALAKLLRQMSITQRMKIKDKCYRLEYPERFLKNE